MRALGFLGMRQPGNGEFPFSHIIPDDELCSLSDGGWVCIQLGGGGKRSECPRPAINFIKVKGDRRRPAKNAEFSKCADVVPAVELFQGFPWTDVPGPAPGPRTARGHPEPLVMAQFKCGSKTCAAHHEGGCGFEMIQETCHCSREEGMVRVRFKNWDSRVCPPHHSSSLLASTCVPTSRACRDGDVSETAQPHNPHALHPRPRPMQVQQLILRPLTHHEHPI